MTEVLKVLGYGALGWFALSVLVATAWALGGKRIFRRPPPRPDLSNVESVDRTNRKAGA
jgi:hypothetical protein